MNVAMKKADKITALVLLIFSAYVILESSKMTLFVEFAPGYGFFPFWLGILMAILSAMLLVDALRRPASPQDVAKFPPLPMLVNIGLILGGLGLYAFLMEIAGYILDTLFLVILLLGVVEREKWHKTLLVAVIMTAALFILFERILGVNLPEGIFGL